MDIVITGDPHGKAIFACLEDPKIMLETQSPFECTFSIANGVMPWHFEIEQHGQIIDVSQLRVAYMRRPIMKDPGTLRMPVAAAKFAMREWEQIVEAVAAICHLLPERRFITLGRAPQLASNKIVQLILARQVGLLIPDTHVTTRPETAKDFCERGSTVYKTLSIPVVDYGQAGRGMIYTSEVSLSSFERVRHAPCLFQRNIVKDHEIRVAVIGERVIAVKLNSQSSTDTSQDWRHAMKDVVDKVVSLPEGVCQSLIALHSGLQIPWGMTDIIVDRDGRYIFLETNPDGAWLWLEAILGTQSITEALCNAIQSKN